jgi:hypothetical protein
MKMPNVGDLFIFKGDVEYVGFIAKETTGGWFCSWQPHEPDLLQDINEAFNEGSDIAHGFVGYGDIAAYDLEIIVND